LQILDIPVNQRSLSVPTNVETAIVGYPSKPFLITTDYPPSVSLTITPSSPGVLFSPTSIQLFPGAAFASFTATVPAWIPSLGDPSFQNFVISYSVTGIDAPLYAVAPTSTAFSVRQSTITVSPPLTLQYDIPSTLYSITLERPTTSSLEITLCGPSSVVLHPSPVVFGPRD